MFHRATEGVIALLLVIGLQDAAAQSPLTDHTFRLDDAAPRPAAQLADVQWLVGSWTGSAFGADFEEVWNPPSAGSMVGMYKVIRDGAVEFYELMLLVEEEGSLAIRVKHFDSDFSAWEDKEEHINFRLVRVDEDAVHFSGLSFYRVDDDRIDGYIAMRTAEGLREEKLVYRRVGVASGPD
jgi:hypothetical protein